MHFLHALVALYFCTPMIVHLASTVDYAEDPNRTQASRLALTSPHRFVGHLKIAAPVQAGSATEERIPKDRDKIAVCPLENLGLCHPYVAKGGSARLNWSRLLLTFRPSFTAEVGMPERSRLARRKFAIRNLSVFILRWAGS